MSRTIFRILGKRGRITIPFEIRQALGIAYNDVVSFEVEGTTVKLKREKICDHCRNGKAEKKNEPAALYDFLDRLSSSEQRDALIHLSVAWAREKEAKPHG